MLSRFIRPHLRRLACFLAMAAGAAVPLSALAADFAVTPIRIELRPGAMNETITISNDATARLRVSMKLMEWSQDADGKDVYRESNDLIYFPRQMELEPKSKRLVRVGLRTPGGVVERAYRLFIEEEPEPAGTPGRAQIALYFRFGVPVFVPPAVPKTDAEVMEPTLAQGKLSVKVRNNGNQQFRLTKITIADGQGYSQELQGWYSLAGTERTYSADIPRDVCRRAKAFRVELEGEKQLRFDRTVNVDPANCG